MGFARYFGSRVDEAALRYGHPTTQDSHSQGSNCSTEKARAVRLVPTDNLCSKMPRNKHLDLI